MTVLLAADAFTERFGFSDVRPELEACVVDYKSLVDPQPPSASAGG
jgi:hypothetical protein